MYTVKLLEKRLVADGTIMFSFEKPSGFTFEAGMAADFSLINPPETDDEGSIRSFSLVSAPYEDKISFATRMRDTAFKRVMNKMPLNSEINVDEPFGNLLLPRSAHSQLVFITGGIGITPFYSMIKEVVKMQLSYEILLFYSNRQPKDAAFLKELLTIEKDNNNISVIYTFTDETILKTDWKGEKGFINKTMLRKYIPDFSLPKYYTAGPPQMVKAMKELLVEMGVSVVNIIDEDFPGY
ncbi:MAG TPA: FAD-dependent oxidoreductase [Ignavibacteria bacterium]|nr:FAD-dependent oxidoreductase [Ignavibacteria bacterium]